jgi:hypothetical protein
MLCDVCSAVYFKPLNELNITLPVDEETKKPSSNDYSARRYYAHHNSREALLRTAGRGCSFCILLSKRVERVEKSEKTESPFVLSQRQPHGWRPNSWEKKVFVDNYGMGYITVHWAGFVGKTTLLNLGRLFSKPRLLNYQGRGDHG